MRLRLHHTAVILCVTTFGLLAHGRQLVEFHAANIGATFHPQQTAETDTLSEEPIPGGDGQVTRALFRWGPTCQNIEFHVRNLTENILPADVTRFTLHLNLPPEHGCKELLLRLRDRKGEIFQCSSRPFAPNEQGPVSREFVLNAATTHSFGKNIDKVIDRPLRLSSLYIRCQDNGRGGALQFDRLLYRVDGEGLFVDFAGDSPMNLLYSLDAPARFRVENAGSVDSQFSGEITLRDSFGGSVTTPLAFPLKAGETTLLTIPDDGQRRFGICYVDYVLRSAQGYELRSDFPFVRMTPAGKAANRSFVFGLGGSSGPYGRTAFTALGINGIRVNSGWYHVQPRRDVWDWSGHDRMVAYREEHGIESLYIVTSPAA